MYKYIPIKYVVIAKVGTLIGQWMAVLRWQNFFCTIFAIQSILNLFCFVSEMNNEWNCVCVFFSMPINFFCKNKKKTRKCHISRWILFFYFLFCDFHQASSHIWKRTHRHIAIINKQLQIFRVQCITIKYRVTRI